MLRIVFCGIVALCAPMSIAAAQNASPHSPPAEPPARTASHWGDELGSTPLAPAHSLPGAAADTLHWPAPPLVDPPRPLRAIYVNAWAFGGGRLAQLVALADSTEINAFVIDVKDDTGYLTYRSAVPTAVAIGADDKPRTRDVEARLRMLAEHGIYPIARIVVAKDPLLASHKAAWAIQSTGGGLWHDRLGFSWVDAFNDSVWVYASQLAAEAVRKGFAEVQYDYVRFPDEPKQRMATAVFASRDSGETLRDGVVHGLRILGQRTRPLGVRFTIDVFGLTTTAQGDMGIGQHWEDLVSTADVVLPMVYPSHYYRGMYDISRPNSKPYEIVHRALEDGLRRTTPLARAAEIRPYLQAFTLGPPRYTPAEVRAQIRAARDVGIESWVLWNPRSAYDPGIFHGREQALSAAGPAAAPIAGARN
ncbi:MAG TPA: putative glycoside hydrolase [Gemmatimonadales bacterium]|nr:putative glycoside hydrolase [Gemmatimonadales bacterium]